MKQDTLKSKSHIINYEKIYVVWYYMHNKGAIISFVCLSYQKEEQTLLIGQPQQIE